jgi:ribosome-associated protein
MNRPPQRGRPAPDDLDPPELDTAPEGADAAPSAEDFGLGDRPSKTRRKKESHDLQALGEALVEMPDNRLVDLPMPEILLDAIQAYRRTKSHEGRRRQMQYIGKLMRRADPEPLREAVAAMQLGQAKDALALHQAEHWRVVLVADDNALERWAAEHPGSDLQQLRSLVRAARKDAAAAPEQRSGRAFRELFKFIRAQQGAPTPGDDAADANDADEAPHD